MKLIKILFICCFGHFFCFGQNNLSISNYQFANIESSVFGDDETSVKLLKFFNNYYFPGSLQNYKSLFKPWDWIKLSEEDYNTWQNTLKSAKLTPLGWHKFKYNGDEIAIIVYELFFERQYFSQRLRAQKIYDTWLYYPMNEKDDDFEEVLLQLSLIKPGNINAFFKESPVMDLETFFSRIQIDKQNTFESVRLADESIWEGSRIDNNLKLYFKDFELEQEYFGEILQLLNSGKPVDALWRIAETNNHKMSPVEVSKSLSKYLGYNVLIPIKRNDSSDK